MQMDQKHLPVVHNRNYIFDNMKAVLVFSVVLAHYFMAGNLVNAGSFGGIAYITSFSFIMQGFIFVSGYFSKNVEKCRATAFKTFLFPYLILMPVMFGIRYLVFGHATLNMAKPTMALWYLLTLFLYRYFIKDLIKVKYILPISFVVSIFSGLVPFFNLYFSIGRTLGFLPFFLLGYYCKAEHIEKLRKIPKLTVVMVLAGLIGFSVFMSSFELLPVSAWYFKSSFGSIGISNQIGVLARVLLTVIALLWILVFLTLLPRKKTWLSVIGQYTMTVYILHILVRYLIKGADISGYAEITSYILLILIAIGSTWLFSRKKVADAYQQALDWLYNLLRKIIFRFGWLKSL